MFKRILKKQEKKGEIEITYPEKNHIKYACVYLDTPIFHLTWRNYNNVDILSYEIPAILDLFSLL
jgi:hypothetical protein